MKFKRSFSVVVTNQEAIEQQYNQGSYSNACNQARKLKEQNLTKGVYVLVEFEPEAEGGMPNE